MPEEELAWSGDQVARPGCVIAYDRVGTGPPVVLLSGGPGDGPGYLAGLGELLAQRGWSAVLVHQRGTGRSRPVPSAGLSVRVAVDDVANFADELGGPLRLVGHSYGATLALLVAGFRPESVSRAVLVGLGPLDAGRANEAAGRLRAALSPDERDSLDAATAERQRAIELGDLARFEGAFMMSMRLRATVNVRTSAGREQYAAALALPFDHDPLAHKALNASLADIDQLAAARTVVSPLLVIYGRDDFEPIGQADQLGTLTCGPVTTVLVEQAAHLPWLDRPDRVAKLLSDFLTAPGR